jgi:hypothetical protein
MSQQSEVSDLIRAGREMNYIEAQFEVTGDT